MSARWTPAVFGLLLSLASCRPHVADEPPRTHVRRADGSVVLTGRSAAYVHAEPARAASGELDRDFTGRIAFDERHVARLGPPVQGRVASVNVVNGDHVREGDVVVSIHSADVATLRAQLAEARTQRQLAEGTVARVSSLTAQQAASQAELVQARATLAQASDEERRAARALAAVGGSAGSSDYQLRSPIEGVVVQRDVAVGVEVHADQDQPLVTVADLSTVWVLLDVYEQDLPRVHLGDEAIVRVSAFPGRTFTGRIAHVAETIDPRIRVAHARIELPNPDGSLRAGMFAQASVRTHTAGTVMVPSSAVLARRDQYFVFVRNPDGSFAEREVRLGDQSGDLTNLVDGVAVGEWIVTGGAILLDAEANEAL